MANGNFLSMEKVVTKSVRECFTFMAYKIQMGGNNNINTNNDDI